MSCPVARANCAWTAGDLECATGLPMTAYRSLIALFSPDLVALAEEPSPGDDQEIGIALDVGREGGEWGRHAHDLECRGVEHFQARRAVELDRFHAAIGSNRNREAQVAVDLAARLGRVVQRADALDLHAPVFLVLRKAIFARVGADKALARPFLVFVDLAVDLR